MPTKQTDTDKNKQLLIPVDFSLASESALLFAAELADPIGADLTVLHVVHDPGDAPGYSKVPGRNEQLRRMEHSNHSWWLSGAAVAPHSTGCCSDRKPCRPSISARSPLPSFVGPIPPSPATRKMFLRITFVRFTFDCGLPFHRMTPQGIACSGS